MKEEEMRAAELSEEELENAAGGYARLGTGGTPGAGIRTLICPNCGTACKVPAGLSRNAACAICKTKIL